MNTLGFIKARTRERFKALFDLVGSVVKAGP